MAAKHRRMAKSEAKQQLLFFRGRKTRVHGRDARNKDVITEPGWQSRNGLTVLTYFYALFA
jgi:hypothetical protein